VISVGLLLAGCGGKLPSGRDEQRSLVSFNVVAPSLTKGTMSAAGEAAVNTLDLLAFRTSTGALDCYVHALSDSRVEGAVTRGEAVNWYVVANAPAEAGLRSMANESQFLSSSTLLTHTSPATMVMSASGTDTFGPEKGEVNEIVLHRYACKITIEDIQVQWLAGFDVSPSCTVDRIVLMNVRGSAPYSGEPTARVDDLWYNCGEDDGSHAGVLASLLGWSGPVTVSGGVDVEDLDVSLYAMPNPSAAATYAGDSPWTPRKTRVAVQITIGGLAQWYAIDLPPMERNTHYVVEHLVILGPGSSAPDMDVNRTNVAFSLNVTPWSTNSVDAGTFPVSEQ